MTYLSIEKNLALKGILLTIIVLTCALIFSHYILINAGLFLRLLISRLIFWLIVGIIFIYAKSIEKQPFILWTAAKRGIVFYLVSTIAVLGCTIVGTIVIAVIFRKLGILTHSDIINEIKLLGIPIKLFTVFTAAFTEELIFRGYLMPRLQLFFKSALWPIIISSILFGLGHIGFGTVVNVAVPLVIGIIFAMYYQKYRNISVLIICHFLIDFYSVIVHR